MTRVLIVDDDEQIRHLYRDLFEVAGYEVDEAGDGLAALEAYPRLQPDVVICDILMPGMNGLLTITEILRINPRARIIAISGGHAEQGDYLAAALQLGAVATFQKPFDVQELLNTTARVAADVDDD